jgi:valyl-tRNA synthetase
LWRSYKIVITEIRRFRNDQGIKTSQKIPGRLVVPAELAPYAAGAEFILKMENSDFTPSAKLEIGAIRAEFDLTGSIDVVAERARLNKDLATAEKIAQPRLQSLATKALWLKRQRM